LVIENVLGFCAAVLTMLMMLGLVVWFCCSVAENITKMRRRLKDPKYDALLRENRRLKGFLADVAGEDPRLSRSRLGRAYYPGAHSPRKERKATRRITPRS
jgi:hypothetical protein